MRHDRSRSDLMQGFVKDSYSGGAGFISTLLISRGGFCTRQKRGLVHGGTYIWGGVGLIHRGTYFFGGGLVYIEFYVSTSYISIFCVNHSQ